MTRFSKDDLRVGLFYILKNNTGFVDALAKINEQLPTYFREIGYIAFGIDAQAHIRYRITDFGRKQAFSVFIALCGQEEKGVQEEQLVSA